MRILFVLIFFLLIGGCNFTNEERKDLRGKIEVDIWSFDPNGCEFYRQLKDKNGNIVKEESFPGKDNFWAGKYKAIHEDRLKGWLDQLYKD